MADQHRPLASIDDSFNRSAEAIGATGEEHDGIRCPEDVVVFDIKWQLSRLFRRLTEMKLPVILCKEQQHGRKRGSHLILHPKRGIGHRHA